MRLSTKLIARWILPTLAAAALVHTASAAFRQRQVLVLYSTRRDAQIAIVGDRELPQLLGQGLRRGVDYYSEYLDSARSADPEYERAFRDFLAVKYSGQRFDLVIAISDKVLTFLDRYRSELFPTTPVVFFVNLGSAQHLTNSTGVISNLNMHGTVSLAAALQPDLRHVFVVTGADAGDKTYEDLARTQLRVLEPRFDITYLSGLRTRDLEARLATLPAQSMVYYLLVGRDGAGESFHPLEYVDRVASVANAPTYCWVDSAIGHGIVGGSLRNQQAGIEAVAQMGLRVLHGEHADSIPPAALDLNVTQVDWRQLRRWGIRASRVPPGTLIRFREPTLWERYQREIAGVAALLLAQTLLISALLVQRKTRQRAEQQVLASRAELRGSYERIRALGSRLLNAQEVERARIARELHDDIGQELALLTIELELAAGLGPDGSGEKDRAAFDALGHAHRIARNIHNLSHSLHPARLHLLGLVPALEGLRRETSRPDVTITFEHGPVPAGLPPETVLCLFRVAQEALQNAIRHSGSREVFMGLGTFGDDLKLVITDKGVGFDADTVKSAGLGLISMRERVEAIGGTLGIRTKPHAGTRIEITLPGRGRVADQRNDDAVSTERAG